MFDSLKGRGAIFVWEMLVLALLLVAGFQYTQGDFDIPKQFGTVPVGVFWYGALGAVLISLKGIFDHAADWDPKIAYWHWSRPIIGAAMGLVLVVIFQSGMLAVGVADFEKRDTEGSAYYVLAFLAGYREESLRELLKRLVDVLFVPADRMKPKITGLAPNTGGPGTEVVITGSDLGNLRNVTFAGKPAEVLEATESALKVRTPADVTGIATVQVETATGKASGLTYTYG